MASSVSRLAVPGATLPGRFAYGGRSMSIARNVRLLLPMAVLGLGGATALVAIPANAVVGHVYTVNRTTDTNATGTCTPAPSNDPCELRWAFNSANADPGSVINVPAGTYALSLGQLENHAVGTQVVGAGNNKTFIDAGGNSRVLDNDGSLTLTGVTVQRGKAGSDDMRGGGLKNVGHLNVNSVVFLDNSAAASIVSG